MKKRTSRALTCLALIAVVTVLSLTSKPVHAIGLTTYTGVIEGAAYLVQIPENWNGTLLLYSHGFRETPGAPNPAEDAPDAGSHDYLLAQGYALAGSSYSSGDGWVVEQALHDDFALLDYFDEHFANGHLTRTIAWGNSLGGMVTAGLVQRDPSRFAGALPMCGVLSGGVGTWNSALDGAFAFKMLLAPNSPIQVTDITDPATNYGIAKATLEAAQNTPQGRARIALGAALSDIPGWFDPSSPEPASTDYVTQEFNQYLYDDRIDFAFAFFWRANVEQRAGGNPSWNTGVNYYKLFSQSIDYQEVKALYAQAGLDLDQDLAKLQSTPRIAANANAVQYLSDNISYNGQISIPVLTMHTTADGLVVSQNERAYSSVVRAEGNGALLREVFVHRANHCSFTPAESITAFQTLIQRVDTGKWGGSTDPVLMNQEASALGSALNVAPPAFVEFAPTLFLRPYNLN
ncbi:MAG TPA: hypothetical protein VFQ25_13955 [Ktedonobacterales bacterium]|nr:hypothetical protein [Ktedonobacterales bacterium]